MATKKSSGVTVRLDPELKARLNKAATNLDLSENDICRHAIRAAVCEIEDNEFRIELPLRMAVEKKPLEIRVRGARAGLMGTIHPSSSMPALRAAETPPLYAGKPIHSKTRK